jgi:alcohol dehydrogenase
VIELAGRTIELTPRPRTVLAAGAADHTGATTAPYGSSALVVSDAGVVAAGALEPVLASLAASGVETVVFSAVAQNPDLATVEAGVRAARAGAAVVVAVGGGACLDTGKAIALGATNAIPTRDLDYRRDDLAPGLPVIALPTTAGTASETNGFGVFADPETHRKVYLGNVSTMPRAAILDPLLGVGVPPRVTAAAGIDALSHALESLSSRFPNPYANALALGVVATIAASLPQAVADGGDVEARAQLLFASHVAGLAQQSGTGLGLAHALGHALSSHLGLPHGIALAAVLPAVLRFNLPVCRDRYVALAEVLHVSGPDEVPDAVGALAAAIGAGGALDGGPVPDDLARTMAADALLDVVIANTPRQPTSEELVALLRELG